MSNNDHDPSLDFCGYRKWEMLIRIDTGGLHRFVEYADRERSAVRLGTMAMGVLDLVVPSHLVKRPSAVSRSSSKCPPVADE